MVVFLLLIASAITATANRVPISPTQCEQSNGKLAPCGPGNDECHRPGYGPGTPQFHVRSRSCAMNDPAAVVYDPQHGVYHDHWEAHLAAPGGQYVRGHAVSRDLVHWAHVPVSLWNDEPYDRWAIFTGSATVVNGTMVQVYPGLCASGGTCNGMTTNTALCIAVPADPSDALASNWTKGGTRGTFTGYRNPVANGTQRDPSSAWRTPAGEWRLTTYGSTVFGSLDFRKWYRLGQQPGFPAGECLNSFFGSCGIGGIREAT